jgi:hypothetical protein
MLSRAGSHIHGEPISPALELQAQLWLGEREAACMALEELAALRQAKAHGGSLICWWSKRRSATRSPGLVLAGLMEESPYADFLKPLSLALRAGSGRR